MENRLATPDPASAVEAEQTRLRLPSRLDWIEPTVEYLKTKALLCGACHPSQARHVVLALHEALSNAVVHGNLEVPSDLKEQEDDAFARVLAERSADPQFAGRTVSIVADFDGRRCQWALTDEGPGFDVDRTLSRQLHEADLVRPGGRGILMMRSLVDEVRFEAGGRRVVLTLYKSAGADKRRQPRQPLQQRVQVAPVREDGFVDWSAAQAAVSRNLSAEGMAVLQAKLADTDRVVIALQVDGQPVYVPAEVRHCRPVGDGMVELGCRFQAVADAVRDAATPAGTAASEAVDRLLDEFRGRPEADNDRRAHPRIGYSQRLDIVGEPGTVAHFGYARDVSAGGIAFITSAPLPRGVKMLSLAHGDGPPLRLLADVVRCVKVVEGFFDVGARFVGTAGEP